MYKTRNTGMGNGVRGTGRMGNVIFRGKSSKIPGNVVTHSGECPQTFRGMLLNIQRNVAKHSRERWMSSNIQGNVFKHSGECPQTFWGVSPNIPANIAKHSRECPQIFRGMSVLLKEIRTEGQFKISFCCFLCFVQIKRIRRQGSPRFSCVTPVVESFPHTFFELWLVVSYWAVSHIESSEASRM